MRIRPLMLVTPLVPLVALPIHAAGFPPKVSVQPALPPKKIPEALLT